MADEDASSSGEKPVGYQLDANRDVDLQKPGARVGHGVQSAPNEAAAGQAVALDKIKSLTGLSLAITDFDISVRARNIRTGKWNEPVEWTATREGKFRGELGVWTVELNLDDPDPAHASALSPTRPHVGYTAIFSGVAGRYHREKGHILVASVDATRPPMPLRKEAKRKQQSGDATEANRIFDQYFLRRR